MREIDPVGCETRRVKRLRRPTYRVPSPNFCWHTDGYDKLKLYGFPIHGCIDGWSRNIIWLRFARSNNKPGDTCIVLSSKHTGIWSPVKLRSDCGTENGIMAAIQCDFCVSVETHLFGTSPANKRIKSWWAQFHKNHSMWWINYFKDLCEKEMFNHNNDLEFECLWFCFLDVIQNDLDYVKEQWTSNRIQNSCHYTFPGILDELYFLPEAKGGLKDFLYAVSLHKSNLFRKILLQFHEEDNMMQE